MQTLLELRSDDIRKKKKTVMDGWVKVFLISSFSRLQYLRKARLKHLLELVLRKNEIFESECYLNI